jgi:dTDP-4-amino-4,6-dideoxygalactose transaminase
MINVTKPKLPPREKLDSYIDKIYETQWITNNGPLLKEFEQKLKEYLGVKNIILVANGTLALQVAYKALELKAEVITTPFSFVATTSSLIWEGLQPNFCDIDPQSLCIDDTQLHKQISDNTSAIVATHVYGNTCNVHAIDTLAKEHNLKVIYDASHCFGINYKDSSILNYGDISTISFHATKIFHSIEGGAIVTKDDALAKKIRLLINFGIDGPENILQLGINAKMNEFQAAMGLCMLDEMDDIIAKREVIWNIYNKALCGSVELIEWNENATHNYSYFPLLFKDEKTLLHVKNKLFENGINARRYFNPSLNTLNYIQKYQACAISEDISSRVLVLPIYPELSLDDVDKIIQIIKENV